MLSKFQLNYRDKLYLGILFGLVGLVVTAGLGLNRPRPIPTPAVPIRIESSAWQLETAAELTVHLAPPQAGQVISLTVIGSGPVMPQPDRPAPGFFGIAGVQLLWLAPEYQEKEAALAAAAGAGYIGLDFDWRRIEPEPGQFDWTGPDQAVALAKRHGLRLAPMLLFTPQWASTAPYAPLDYHRAPPVEVNNYRDFVFAVVSRYKPYGASPLTADGYGITDWVIWNEPNVRAAGQSPQPGGFWTGSLAEYVQLLRAGYEGVHAADPAANVLNGGLADIFWQAGELDLVTALESFYDPNGDGNTADGGRPFFDTLNLHTYQGDQPTAAWYKDRLEAVLRVMARFGDEQKPIWITETGYGSIPQGQTLPPDLPELAYVDEVTQAEAVGLVYQAVAAYPQVKRLFWWSLRDYYRDNSAGNPAMEAHYGLLRVNFAPKPAYLAYAHLTGRPVLHLAGPTDEMGQARIAVPASFINQPGTYTVLVALDGTTLAGVATYNPSSKG